MEKLLPGAMKIASQRGEKLILYIGYLGNAGQVKLIKEQIRENRALISHIIVDPVSGDHGRLYVPSEVVEAWPELLSLADWAMPNFTELQLMSGLPSGSDEKEVLQAFQERFPKLSFIGTSMPEEKDIRLVLFHNGIYQTFTHKKEEANYGGTGDVFTAIFIRHYLLRHQSAFQAMRIAAEGTHRIIANSMMANSPDLILP